MADPRITQIVVHPWGKDDPYFTFTSRRYRWGFIAKHRPNRIEPDSKRRKVHRLAGSHDALLDVFTDAIAIGATLGGRNRMWGFLAASVFALVGFVGTAIGSTQITRNMSVISASPFIIVTVIFLIMLIWSLKSALLLPCDFPMLFNRADKTITYMPQQLAPFWKFWSIKLNRGYTTEKWDTCRVRTYTYMASAGGGPVTRVNCKMMLLWGGLNGDEHELREATEIGFKDYYGDEQLWFLWEHIRRYMEEDGPAIRRGEQLRKLGPGRPIVYPPEAIHAAGGPPLSHAEVEKMAASAPGAEA